MTYVLGARRGIAACASERGTFAVLALDHRQNLRNEIRSDDPPSVSYDEMVGFKRAVEVEAACQAGASGVVVGRSVWAEAATMALDERDRFLTTTGRERLRCLTELVDAVGRPWYERSTRITSASPPGDGWYRVY